jgi:ankyrin repeat protein
MAKINKQKTTETIDIIRDAIYESDIDKVKLLLKSNKYNSNEIHSILSCCIRQGHWDMVKLILKYGADIKHRYENDETILIHIAKINPVISIGLSLNFSYRYVDIFKTCIELGADVNAQDKNGNTALIYIANEIYDEDDEEDEDKYDIHHKMAKILLKAGAKIDICNKNGDDALTCATKQRNDPIIKLLTVYKNKK